jgi:heme O synthase-like polyprenyltransferase
VCWPRSHDARNAAGKRLFGFSILYLFLLFAALLVEHALRGVLA